MFCLRCTYLHRNRAFGVLSPSVCLLSLPLPFRTAHFRSIHHRDPEALHNLRRHRKAPGWYSQRFLRFVPNGYTESCPGQKPDCLFPLPSPRGRCPPYKNPPLHNPLSPAPPALRCRPPWRPPESAPIRDRSDSAMSPPILSKISASSCKAEQQY